MSGAVYLPGIGPLAGAYDAFLVDQWGVLHEGSAAFPAALKALRELRAAAKKIAVVTNSGRRAQANQARLRDLGFAAGLFDAIVSSGEVAWRRHADGAFPWSGDLGRRCLLMARQDGGGVLDGLPVVRVDRPEEADFILNAGVEAERRPFSDYEALLRRAAERRLVMICLDPDLQTPSGGELLYGAGAVAERYREMGCEVRMFGKPGREIFEAALEELGAVRDRTLMVGDSLRHDVAGARSAGLKSVLVLGGIHAREIGEPFDESAVDRLCRRVGVTPDFAVPAFAW